MKAWRNSASLILLAKDLVSGSNQACRNDVRLLLQKRSSKSKAFPDAMVFPGGTIEDFDISDKWLGHFRSFGFESHHFNLLQRPNASLHPITLKGEDSIRRHISLRITAIRETFEELGILICRRRDSKVTDQPWASYIGDFDVEMWQEKVSADPTNFLLLCEQLDCYPDIWSLYLWSNWLTPIKAVQTPRFNTIFFIAGFVDKPSVYIQKKEVATAIWTTADEQLKNYDERKINLIFPQFYELSRLGHQKNATELMNFASKRNSYGCDLFYPILTAAHNGIAMILPGDEAYPTIPDYMAGIKSSDPNKTLEDLREDVRIAHRGELRDGKLSYFVKNFTPPHYHLSVGDGNIPKIVDHMKSSL